MREYNVDVLIFGGGIAGLFCLDKLVRDCYNAYLIEKSALGNGQTVCSQGIIHGGMKYVTAYLAGTAAGFSKHLREMPAQWHEMLSGKRKPDLSSAKVYSQNCLFWTLNQGGMLADAKALIATAGLNSLTELLKGDSIPEVLKHARRVYAINETVVDCLSLLEVIANEHQHKIGTCTKTEFINDTSSGQVSVTRAVLDEKICIKPQLIVFAAGEGNEYLARAVGVQNPVLKRLPLHQAYLVSNKLPLLYGHQIAGDTTGKEGPQITITTHLRNGVRAWNIGGKPAEQGVNQSASELEENMRKILNTSFPDLRSVFDSARFGSFKIDRAEMWTPDKSRITDPVVRQIGKNVFVVYPTKFAFAPLLADWLFEAVKSVKPATKDFVEGLIPACIGKNPWHFTKKS